MFIGMGTKITVIKCLKIADINGSMPYFRAKMSESERKEYLAKQAIARKEKMRQQMKERLKRQRKVRQ